VLLPEGKWPIRLSDTDTGNILFPDDAWAAPDQQLEALFPALPDRGLVRPRRKSSPTTIIRGQGVLVQFPGGTIGDTVGWFPYAVKFQALHGCKLTCAMAEWLIPLFAEAYPDITFVGHDGIKADTYYAHLFDGPVLFDDGRPTSACQTPTGCLHTVN